MLGHNGMQSDIITRPRTFSGQAMGHRSATILVIDDSRRQRSALAERLRTAGFEAVHTVADPREATMRLREIRPDVVAIEHGPNIDSLSLIEALQSSRIEPDPALLIVATSDPGAAVRHALLMHQFCDLVLLDEAADELFPRLSALAAGHARIRELVRKNRELEGALADRSCKLNNAVEILRKAEQRLHDQLSLSREESRSKSEFLAMAAHELRTPLHAVIGFADLLKQQVHGPLADDRYLEYANEIHGAAGHLLKLVNDTLDLAKAESGQIDLDLRHVDLGRVVEDSARLLRNLADQSGVVMSVRVPETPLRIRTDPDKVRQVVVNLCSNAIKFTPRGGHVMVEVRPDECGGAWILIVRDTGPGMTAGEVSQALKPFKQLQQTTQSNIKGTGLGLPLTRRFVEMLGGTMDISSEPGQGTTVTVRLPPDAAPAQPQEAAE
jgi:two-component system, cell cycle sensor histidine kinase PleC